MIINRTASYSSGRHHKKKERGEKEKNCVGENKRLNKKYRSSISPTKQVDQPSETNAYSLWIFFLQ